VGTEINKADKMAEQNESLIRVTADDIAAVETAASAAEAVQRQPQAGRSYGNINSAFAETEPLRAEERPSLLLQGWFYLGAAGLVGAVTGWAICERAFIDGGEAHRWGNTWMIPMVTMMMMVCFAIAESVVERSLKKAAYRLAMVVPLGVVFGFVFAQTANVIYAIGLNIIVSMGIQTYRNPAWWLVRATAWASFGVAAGLCYGLVGKAAKKAKYGVLGGAIGAFLGGILFDPIAMLVDKGGQSRAIGFALVGMAAGAAMGFVESALKDRWVYVSAGPLAGKQFILYKSQTTIGSDQSSDIYLFKDVSIAPQHATIDIRGVQATLHAHAPLFVSGVPTHSRVLLSGDIIQIGRYMFKYNERHR
jgi:hypothetical protein